jgi:hypothetical protein
MKKCILLFLINSAVHSNLFAQQTRFAVHVSNPLSWGLKAGVKIEICYKKSALLLTGVQYFNNLFNQAGPQGGLEWRTYTKPAAQQESKYFYYVKAIYGLAEPTRPSGSLFIYSDGSPGFKYSGLGIGLGKKFFWGRFFLDSSAGLQYTYVDVKQSSGFYLFGQGGIIDLRLHGGIEF